MPRAFCRALRPDAKIKMLLELKDDAEIVIAINADAIEKTSAAVISALHMILIP